MRASSAVRDGAHNPGPRADTRAALLQYAAHYKLRCLPCVYALFSIDRVWVMGV